MFSRFIHVVASAALALTTTTPDEIDIPRDVTEDMVLRVIWENNIKSPSGKSAMSKSNQGMDPSNKRKHIEYDHECARNCYDWMGPVLHFPDISFESTFRIT